MNEPTTSQPAPDVIVFDMDGVLVEVMQSYRETIRETVHYFTGELISHDEIQDFKNAGGWNNDWPLSHRLISDRGVKVEYADVVDRFNKIFLGENGDGLILKEQWMPRPGILESLSERASLAIFTGRVKYEVEPTLKRFAPGIKFDPIISDDLVANSKPAPDGLEMIKLRYPGKQLWYLGDTVDDARSAQAAGVPFIGVSTPHNPRYEEISANLHSLDAFAVIADINELKSLVEGAAR